MMGVSFEPTEEQRKTVRAMSGFGIPQDDIATLLEIDAKTLRKHFRRELDRGMVEATAKVAQSLFLMATQGKNVAAAIFWMKARAGWQDRQADGAGKDVKPLTVNIVRFSDTAGEAGGVIEATLSDAQEPAALQGETQRS